MVSARATDWNLIQALPRSKRTPYERYKSEWIISECAVIWEEFSKAIFMSAFHNAYCDTSCARVGSSSPSYLG
jgi:hypothetical protein